MENPKLDSLQGSGSALPKNAPVNKTSEDHTAVRSCARCEEVKLDFQFYDKGKSRKDNVCSDCRKTERNSRYKNRKVDLQRNLQPPGLETPMKSAENKKGLLSKEEIQALAEAFLLLEAWRTDLDAQGEISNSNEIQVHGRT